MTSLDDLDAFTAAMDPGGAGGGYDEAVETANPGEKRKTLSNDAKPKKQVKVFENRAIYVTNLPRDATAEELAEVFKKYGMIDQGVDGKPRVKLYTDEKGEFNGEALIVYFKKDSVDLAIRLMDDYELRLGDTKNGRIRVEEADSSRRKNTDADKIAGKLVRQERKVLEQNRAQLQKKLAEWSDNEEEVEKAYAPKKNKWAKMCIIKNVFRLSDLEDDDAAILEIKEDMRGAAEKYGDVTNVVLYDEEPAGIVSVRFKDFEPAKRFREAYNGKGYNNAKLEITIAEDRPKFKKSGNGGDNKDDDSEDGRKNYEDFLNDGDSDA